MSQENVEVIRRMYERWLQNDATLFEAFDPDIELHPDPAADWVGVNDTYRGHDGLRSYMAQVYEAFEDYRPEVEELLDAGDTVITLAIEHGRGRGSGATVEARRTAHVWTMRAHKAIRLDLYLDRERALEAVGLSEYAKSQENVEIIRLWWDGLNKEGMPPRDLCDETIVIRNVAEVPLQGPYQGYEGVRQWVNDIFDVFHEPPHVELGQSIEAKSGEQVVTMQRLVGRARHTEIDVDYPWAAVWTIRNGVVLCAQGYASWSEALEAVGLSD